MGSRVEGEVVEKGELLARHRVVSLPTLVSGGKGCVQATGMCPSRNTLGAVLQEVLLH